MSGTSDAASPALAIVQAAWNAAARDWNPDTLTAVYTEDALFFGGRPGHSVGSSAIREYFASYDGVIESATLALVEQHFIRLGPDCFLAQGYGEFSFVISGGRTSNSRLRTTLVIVSQHGEWKIRQHHFSTSPDTPPI
ncbi:YybH family protein [Paraburkholderia sp. D1E]|uniref:YybH family protein n=1 Tax=Paraburkholderia sp. D1E TaxID=3461398 RepID=UPI004046430D